MRIGFNMSQAAGSTTGVGVYARGLYRHLCTLMGEDQIVPLAMSSAPRNPGSFRGRARRIVWEHFFLAGRAAAEGVDVFHNPDHSLPIRGVSCPRIVTVHDLSFVVRPEFFGATRRAYKRAMLQRAVDRAARIVADSQHTKRDLIERLGVPDDRIAVVYPGVEECFRVIEDEGVLRTARQRYGLPREFVLFVGAPEPRKNLGRLLQALRRCPSSPGLVVVGAAGGGGMGRSPTVLSLGRAPQSDMPAIYNLATMLAYPSLYEGFGFPPLEAMACGTPVLTSGISSLPEVVSDAAVLVDPYSVDEMAAGIEKLWGSESLRRDLRRRGLARSGAFAWDRAARQVREVYREAANRKPGEE